MPTQKDRQADRDRPKRWLIDTNVWSGVADAGLGSDLVKAAKRKHIEILAAPSVLYELLRTPNESVRKRFMDVITLPHWKRLMPETFSETKEILAEIRRLRPHWLRTTPNRSEYMKIFHDWRSRKGGMWQRARDTPSKEAGYIDQLDGAMLPAARCEARQRRKGVNESGLKNPAPLSRIYSTPTVPFIGWKGDDIAAWRFETLLSVTLCLEDPEHPYTSWLDADVDVRAMLSDRAGWVSFWFYDVDHFVVPRCWLRWAFNYLQSFRKVTDGTPCDAQLATYLPEADIVLSSDSGFIDRIEECRKYAPCLLPIAERLPRQRPQNAYHLIKRIEQA
jgi:hypothetical protein